jgi:hypothetical protein
MSTFSSIALFCEDIREEKSGQDTIVGTLPDTLQIAGPPPTPNAKAMLSKIGVYLRINFNADGDKPKDVSAKVLNTNNDIITQSSWDSSLIDKAFADAKTNQIPLVGLLLKIVVGPFQIADSGKITAIATIDGQDHVAGVLNIIVPIASQPPA